MPLIVVPLPAGPDESDSLREAVFELGERTLLSGERQTPEPLRIVPYDPIEWTGKDGDLLSRRGVLTLPGPEPVTTFRGRFARALDDALSHVARARTVAPDAPVPRTVVAPISVLSAAVGDRARAAVASSSADIEAVAQTLLTTEVGAETTQPWLDVRYQPWVFFCGTGGPDLAPWLSGPPSFNATRVFPLVHTGIARNRSRLDWADYGKSRLLSELLLLLALSASRDDLDEVLPPPSHDAGSGQCVYLAHSALFEYPVQDLQRRALLRRLRPRDGEPSLVPDPTRLDALATEAARDEALARQASDHFEQQFGFAVSARVLEDDRFDAVLAPPAIAPPFERLGPLVAPRLPPVRPVVRSGAAHDAFLAAVSRHTAGESLRDQMLAALRRGNDALAAARRSIEEALRVHLAGSAKDASPSVSAVGRTLAFLDTLRSKAQKLAAETARPEGTELEPVLERAAALRDSWLAREKLLLERAEGLPGLLAMMLEAGAVATGVLLLMLLVLVVNQNLTPPQLTLRLLASVAIAVAVGGLLLGHRGQAGAAYETAWKDVDAAIAGEAKQLGRDLVRRLNRRARFILGGATEDLRQALEASRSRLATEIQGFLFLVDDEISLLRHLEPDGRGDERGQAFRYTVGMDGRPDIEIDRGRFQTGLSALWQRALALSGPPAPVTVEDYRDFLDKEFHTACGEDQTVVELTKADALMRLREARDAGMDERWLSGSFPANTTAPPKRLLLVGGALAERFGLDEHAIEPALIDGSGGPVTVLRPPDRRAATAFPSELALVFTIQAWSRPEGGPDGN